jgi:hypothetical protein
VSAGSGNDVMRLIDDTADTAHYDRNKDVLTAVENKRTT